jgi:hypothetical protein
MDYSRYCPGIYLKGLRKNIQNVSQDNRCPGLDSNGAASEYKSRVLRLYQPPLSKYKTLSTGNTTFSGNQRKTKIQEHKREFCLCLLLCTTVIAATGIIIALCIPFIYFMDLLLLKK